MCPTILPKRGLDSLLLLVITFLSLAPCAVAQSAAGGPTPAPAPAAPASPTARGEEKAEQILARAVEGVGGRSFLGVTSIVSRGFYTPFSEGRATLPRSFVDYLVFPDRERTEFRGGGVRDIQTNVGDTGWLYDGASRTIKDMRPQQAKDFQTAMRTSIDNILRGWWRKEGALLSYVGRREAGLARRNEVVRLTYPDGFTVEFEFGARDGLPAKVLYRRRNADDQEVAEEDRFAQYITSNGVTVPYVVDHYREGMQTSRINYESILFNQALPDSLFARPADVKALK